MSALNIVNVSTIYAKTVCLAVPASTTALLTNSASSGKVLKLNSLYIANVNGTSAADITVDIYKNQTTSYRIAYTISVPADSTVVLISKDSGIYLEENDSIRVLASSASYLEATLSYEELS